MPIATGNLTLSQIQQTLRTFLFNYLPTYIPLVQPGVEIVAGQVNRVPEPTSPDFVVMTPIRRVRLGQNVDAFADTQFTASIAGTVMTVTTMGAKSVGSILNGATIYGAGVASGTAITSLGTGTGGVGTYNVSPSQNVSSETMYAGTDTQTETTELTFQIDVHGPNSSDYAPIITAAFYDEAATEYFLGLGEQQPAFLGVNPLTASEPTQVPFINEGGQYEYRWMIELRVQVDVSAISTQRFAQTLTPSIQTPLP